MKINIKAILAPMLLALALSGCTDNASDTSGEKIADEAVTEAATVVSEAAETAAVTEPETENTEVSYMEKCKELLAEMPPQEVLTDREGVTYPSFEKFTYYSQTAERDTPVNVLLPVEYSQDKQYPVLYILHGYWDNEDWMARDIVRISTMLNNLVAEGAAEEMIVVCPYIYCSKDMQYCTGMDTQNTLNYDNFINDMMTDLMPFIEKEFSVKPGRENTAVTGFSMGGRESLFIGVSHPEKFGYIGSVCTAPGLTEGSGDPWMLKTEELTFGDNKPYVLLLSAAQNDGVVGVNPTKYKSYFKANGEEYLWHSMSQTGHDHSSVTPHLYNFMRMIFKGDKE